MCAFGSKLAYIKRANAAKKAARLAAESGQSDTIATSMPVTQASDVQVDRVSMPRQVIPVRSGAFIADAYRTPRGA